MDYIKMYVTAVVSFLTFDSIWLGVIAPKFYKKHIGFLMAKNPNFVAAGMFYLLFIAGLVFFVIQPAVADKSWTVALYRGAFFGLVTYATFDLTSQAVLKDWPLLVTGIDLLWGMCITSVVSVVAYTIFTRIF